MPEFKSISLADQVFDKLQNDIIAGVYPRGEILTELKLVEQLNVSRTPIREALRRLQQERLIEDTGRGSMVLGITLEDLEDIMNVRMRVEGLAAYYATVNLTEQGAKELRRITELQDFYYDRNDVDRLQQMDDQFHNTIYTLSGRTVLQDILRPLHRKTQRYRRKSFALAARGKVSVGEHKAICDAIVNKNAELAEQLMHQHIENAKKTMIERFSQNG